jgi:hypothetical protein
LNNWFPEKLEIFNLVGNLILSRKIDTDTMSVDLSKYANGTYVLKIHGNNQSIVKELIKQ